MTTSITHYEYRYLTQLYVYYNRDARVGCA